MCGLVAMFARGAPLVPGAIRAPTRLLAHRGPDGEGTWTSADGRVSLGHRRLSMVDLETGAQPLSNEDGSLVAVVNGEFYGFEAIRADLEALGHRFRTRADSEILLHLYEEHGAACLGWLRGEFALALWDQRGRRLFAARDRFGIKPLFFGLAGQTLCLASEVKALIAAGVPTGWDEESFAQHVLFCMDADRTLFRGIAQVPPGHYLMATAHGQEVVRYWDLDYPAAAEVGPRDEAESAAELRDLLDDAVRTRMRADVRIGCMLSGGLDSATVAAFAAPYADGGLDAFTVTFDHEAYDEGSVAREIAAHVGASYSPHAFGYRQMADQFAEAAWHGESLCFNAHAIARFALARAIRAAGIKAVVAGEGGDELFAGYLFSRQDMLEAEGGGAAAEPSGRPSPALETVRQRLGTVPNVMRGMAHSRALFRELLAPDLARSARARDPFVAFLDRLDVDGQMAGRHPVMQGLYVWSKGLLPNYVLAAERLDLASGVEVRQPLLDHVLFDYVRRLPPSLLIQGGTEKHLLRLAARPLLPERIHRMPKHPFTAPPATLTLDNPFLGFLQDTLRSAAMASVPLVEQRAVRALLDALPRMSAARRIALDSILLMLCSACILQQRLIAAKAVSA